MFDKSFRCPSGNDVDIIVNVGPWCSVSTWSGTVWSLLMAGF